MLEWTQWWLRGNDMKKAKLIGYVLGVILFIALVAGATYALFRFATESGNIGVASDKIDIDYTISNANLSGTLFPDTSRSGGLMESVTARLNAGSAPASLNIYITPTVISGISPSALEWEVDVIDASSNIINHYSGNLSGAVVNNAITVVNDYALSSNLLTFNIYVWLNGDNLTSINSNNQFIAKISADTTPITGEF